MKNVFYIFLLIADNKFDIKEHSLNKYVHNSICGLIMFVDYFLNISLTCNAFNSDLKFLGAGLF